MQSSYAVYWNEGTGERHAGRFDLEAAAARLVGHTAHGTCKVVAIRFADIESVRYRNGRLSVERRAQPPLEIGSVDAPGALHELAVRLQTVALPV